MEEKDKNIFLIILSLIGVFLFVSIISKIASNLKKYPKSDLISEEGKKILNDPQKREKLRNAIEEYHRSGKWDLSNVE
jgi:hypothetical protein